MVINHRMGLQWRIQDFSLGGADPLGGAGLRRGSFLVEMYAEANELGPVGGGGTLAAPLDPPMDCFILTPNILLAQGPVPIFSDGLLKICFATDLFFRANNSY